MATRKWVVSVSLALALFGAALLLGGCASSAMRGTPFYTGVTHHPPGAMERRLNLWPVAYYYDPFLSVVWPIFEKTDTHVLVRPLAGVAKLDCPQHQYNLLWPIGEFDVDDDDYRFFPFFWGDKGRGPCPGYFALFPLVWYMKDSFSVLFPVLWYFPNDDNFCVFPVFWYEKDDHFALFPLYMNFKDEKSTHVLWPLFHVRRDEEPSWHVGPFAGDWKKDDFRYSFLLFPLGHRYRKDDYALDMFLPFYAKESGRNRDTLVTPLYISNDDREKGEKFRFIAPTWFDYQKPDGGMRTLFPLYFDRREGEEKLWLTPLAGRYQRPGADTWIASPLLSAHTKADTYDELWAIAPLTRFRWGEGPNRSHVLPFCYYDGDKEQFFSLPYASMKNKDDSVTKIVPLLLSSKTKGKDFTRTWSPWPLVQNEWGPEGRKSFVFPLYAYNAPKDRFLSIPYSRWHTVYGQIRAFFGPLYVHGNDRDENWGSLLWPLTRLRKSDDGWDGWFTLFIHNKSSGGHDTWLPWPLVRSYEKPRKRGSWLFPLWSQETTRYLPPREETLNAVPPAEQSIKEIAYIPAEDQEWTPETSNFRLLFWLYTYEQEHRLDKTHARVLWHVVDYKREGPAKSLDVFPAVSYDSNAETGFKRFAFLWRFVRYQRDKDGGKKLDLLFIPVMRKHGTTATE
jgi:hypothetical protein